MAILERLQARAQIEPETLRQRHGHICVPVGIDGQLRGLKPLVTHHPFDGGAGLSFIEHNGLCKGDAPRTATVEALRLSLGRWIGPDPPRWAE